MRRALVVATVLCCMASGHAYAQIQVTDGPSLAQQLKDFAQKLKEYQLLYDKYQLQIRQAQTQFQTLQAFVQDPVHNVGAVLTLIKTAGYGSAVPVDPYTLQNLLTGGGGLASKFRAISNLSQTAFNSNSVYQCRDNSWACQQSTARATSIANQQGLAMNTVQTLNAHRLVLEGLHVQLEQATTPAAREALSARIAMEQAWNSQEHNQLIAAQAMASAQQVSFQQQANERNSQDLKAFIDNIPK